MNRFKYSFYTEFWIVEVYIGYSSTMYTVVFLIPVFKYAYLKQDRYIHLKTTYLNCCNFNFSWWGIVMMLCSIRCADELPA